MKEMNRGTLGSTVLNLPTMFNIESEISTLANKMDFNYAVCHTQF